MMSKLSSKKPIYQTPQMAALMASINGDDNSEEEPEVVVGHPPVTYEEFLQVESISEWPQRLTSEGVLDLSMVDIDCLSKEKINDALTKSAPFGFENFDAIEEALVDYERRLTEFTTFMTNPADNISSRLAEGLFHAPSQENLKLVMKAPAEVIGDSGQFEYLDEAANADAVKLHPSRRVVKKDMKQALQEEAQALKTRNISYVSFPGFRPKELTELPSQLEAPQLLNKVTEAQIFNKGFLPLWKKLFLSEASAGILQDAFWWIFLEMFESNPEAQDRIFTRMAGSYIALFINVHPDIRDKFFTVYPRCLSQAVYLTFYEAFPESLDRFGEEFVTETSSHIYQWIFGIKPPVGHWKSWPFEKLSPRPVTGRSSMSQYSHRRMSAISSKPELILSESMKFDASDLITDSTLTTSVDQTSQVMFKIDDTTVTNSVQNSITNDRTRHGTAKSSGTRHGTAKSPGKSLAPKIQPFEDSAPAGPGPDMERVLFNLSGRSPLVAHYLYMKNLRQKETVGKLIKRTEVVREPPPGVTFNDVIQKSKKTVRRLHNERKKSEEDTETYIKKLHHRHRKAIKKLKEDELNFCDPMNLKVKSDKVVDDAQEKGYLQRSYREITKPSSQELSKDDEPHP